ncbi:MAG: glutamate--tRNA ligase, partial [Candidatus Altiarchaeota archaeon]|nr:glutamate--tRNA ligase [Candidatus Altiarchaeota archaeon]
ETPEKSKPRKFALPDLPNVKGPVVLRFAPNPSGPLHIGHARTALLNDEYVKRYGGKLILRFEDTDPKRVDPEAYKMIEEDMKWLGIGWQERIIQSKRLSVYMDVAIRLIKKGHAYVCTCGQEEFKKLKDSGKACPCRGNSVEENMKRWEKMKEGVRGMVLNLKTDIKHQNPALRDFPLMRAIEERHPLTGRTRDLYPLMNFSVTVDDHFLGLTHVLRGKDHIMNTQRQMYLYEYLNWKPPEFIHNGLMGTRGANLSTSGIREGIDSGIYTGWDDVELATLRALKKRGIQPEAIRKLMLTLGAGEVDVTFEWINLYAENKKIIEPRANRYFFVPEPMEVWVTGLPKQYQKIKVPLHPDFSERGFRDIPIKREGDVIKLFIAKSDSDLKKGDEIRLKNFCNVRIMESRPLKAEYVEEKNLNVKKIQWLPEDIMGCEVIGPEKRHAGFCETACRLLKPGDIIQFERFGFVRVDQVDSGDLICYFTHE